MYKKESTLCDFRQIEEDSNEHMLIHCEVVKSLWREVELWILEIGVIDYVVDEQIIILGELQKSHWINAVILNTCLNLEFT